MQGRWEPAGLPAGRSDLPDVQCTRGREVRVVRFCRLASGQEIPQGVRALDREEEEVSALTSGRRYSGLFDRGSLTSKGKKSLYVFNKDIYQVGGRAAHRCLIPPTAGGV